jgi:hypothetical protein
LIELSIVLIIIGLLIAGVSGGKSLIQSARVMGATKELINLKIAINTFYERNDRLPGDTNNDGIIAGTDSCTDTTATNSSYDDFKVVGGELDGSCVCAPSATWVELYIQGLWGWKPAKGKLNIPDRLGESTPFFKHLQLKQVVSGKAKYAWYEQIWSGKTSDYSVWIYNRKGSWISVQGNGMATCKNELSWEDAWKIDRKLDDGVMNTGNVVGRGVKNNAAVTDKTKTYQDLGKDDLNNCVSHISLQI